ncbi:IclR family transcriptional regulator [Pelagibacterium lentulum]|uniref:IclR family transcriptional regulator n=1 Tax=Pelagibacterium lentulum TaxID=2029865 RepID=A0A916VW98_9HYPH|nr:IclR family transcriptional regulator [Pelagibacterium lentulum]GGA45983.1 IclR family transcriptional regulator [Pelagibacterium lentulum]
MVPSSKAFAILAMLGEQRKTIGAADVARELGMNAITAHRFLRTLAAEGALVEERRGRYRLGYMLVDLGVRAQAQDDLGRHLQPLLDALTRQTEEASMATIYQEGMAVCIARAMPNRSLSVDIRVGDRLEAYCTAHGKLWLAYLPERERTDYLKRTELRAWTLNTVASRAALEAEIATIADQGHAYNLGEREEGITAIAVPVVTRDGKMVAGISMFGPTSRIDRNRLDAALEYLKSAASSAQDLLYGA